MKIKITCTLFLAMLLTSCAPAPESPGGVTVGVSTAEVATVLPGWGSGTQVPFPTPEPPTAIPTLPAGLSPIELKYRLLNQFPDFFFCDPDFYPIARDDEMSLALERFPEIQANAAEFQIILNHMGLSGTTNFSNDQKLLIYQQYKKLNAIQLELVGDKYQFQVQTSLANGEGFINKGTIDKDGNINIEDEQTSYPNCPICLAAQTQIETPNGPVAVEDLRVGDIVWTQNASGERIAVPVSAVTRVPVPRTHQMVHLILSDGRELWASPGHPTIDGRNLGDLHAGDILDGAKIVSAERVHYDQSFTYDLLPAGRTGFYWANGILIASTLSQ